MSAVLPAVRDVTPIAREVLGRARDLVRVTAGRDLLSIIRAPASISDEIARAASRYTPSLGDLDPVNAQRLVSVAEEALTDLHPTIVVNRPVDRWTVGMLESADAFPTIFTGPVTEPLDVAYRAAAWVNMRSINIWGGPAGGSTIFGSVQFAPAHALGRTRGVSAYGQIAFTLDDAVLRATTITGRDSFGGSAMPAPWSMLPEVLAERLARYHGFVDDLRAPRTSYLASVETGPLDPAIRQAMLLDLLGGPRSEAVEHVRRVLGSPLPTLHNHFVEAQIRDVSVGDIVSWQLERQEEVRRAALLVRTPARLLGPAHSAPDPALLERIRSAAELRGIPEVS